MIPRENMKNGVIPSMYSQAEGGLIGRYGFLFLGFWFLS
jgi:hypothetical protein